MNIEDSKSIDDFKNRIDVEVAPKTGIITLTTELPDRVTFAELTKKCMDLLQQYVINYKIIKIDENHKFINDRYNEAKNEFKKPLE